jgi:hypothetical protein
VLRWATESGRRLELLRTDLSGLPAVLTGAAVAAIGFSTSTRHVGVPFVAGQRDEYNKRRRSPLVFVPRLLHWQRASILACLAPWDGAGVTHCDCPVCARAGADLLRFDAFSGRLPNALETEVREHDELALAGVIRQIMSADDPTAELKFRRVNAVHRSRSVATSLNVALDGPPAWLAGWD